MALYERLRSEVRQRWRRDLPFEEVLFDRWERAKSLGFGPGSSIYHSSYVYGDVRVGSNTWIGPHTILDGTGGMSIGDYCSISAGVQIYTHDTVRWSLSGGAADPELAPVTIGDRCYIGSQTVVAKGVSIGDGSVIGACSFVNRDVAPGAIAFGIPCRRVGSVSADGDGTLRLVVDRHGSFLGEG
jgi:acetyltransferase-like isoleucine patch superfamily enzyme